MLCAHAQNPIGVSTIRRILRAVLPAAMIGSSQPLRRHSLQHKLYQLHRSNALPHPLAICFGGMVLTRHSHHPNLPQHPQRHHRRINCQKKYPPQNFFQRPMQTACQNLERPEKPNQSQCATFYENHLLSNLEICLFALGNPWTCYGLLDFGRRCCFPHRCFFLYACSARCGAAGDEK